MCWVGPVSGPQLPPQSQTAQTNPIVGRVCRCLSTCLGLLWVRAELLLLLQGVQSVLEELNPVVRGLHWRAEEGAPSSRAPMLICFPSCSSRSGRETRAPWQKKLMEQLSNVPKTGRSTGQELQS